MKKIFRRAISGVVLLLALISGVRADTIVNGPITFSTGISVASDGKVTIDNTAWTTFVPTLTCGSGTLTSASANGRYKQLGKTTYIWVEITITTAGTCNGPQASLPVNGVALGSSIYYQILAGVESTSGSMARCQIQSSGTVMTIVLYNNTNAATNGGLLLCTGTYEGA